MSLFWSFRRAGQFFLMQRTPCEQQEWVQEGGEDSSTLSAPHLRQTTKGVHPMRSYIVKAEPQDNDLCGHLKVQSGL